MARSTSYGLMPFLQFTICHMVIIHLSRPMELSSMIVPVFRVNCGALRFSRHYQALNLSRNRTSFDPQRGQVTPLGQRRATKYSRQFVGVREKDHCFL